MGSEQRLPSGSVLHVETHGDESSAGLLCIHGLGGGAYFFTALGDALKSHAHTVAFDLPGHGFSPRDPQGFCFDRTADRVVELARLHSPRPMTLLGHSLGVIVALKAYSRAPELFSGMIFVGGIPEATPDAKARLLERAAFIRARGTLAGLGAAIVPHLLAPEALHAMPGILGPMQRLVEINDAANYADTCEALSRVSATDIVANVRVPCRLIVGSADGYASPTAVRAFAEKLPRHPSIIEFPNCGHFPFFEKPVEFHAAVKGFMDS